MSKQNISNDKSLESKLNEMHGRRNVKRLKRSTTNQRGNSRRYIPVSPTLPLSPTLSSY